MPKATMALVEAQRHSSHCQGWGGGGEGGNCGGGAAVRCCRRVQTCRAVTESPGSCRKASSSLTTLGLSLLICVMGMMPRAMMRLWEIVGVKGPWVVRSLRRILLWGSFVSSTWRQHQEALQSEAFLAQLLDKKKVGVEAGKERVEGNERFLWWSNG